MKGSALLYVVLLLALLLTVVLGLSVLILSQFEIMKNMGNSTVAFYAADAGIERMLSAFVAQNETLTSPYVLSGVFSNSAEYKVSILCKDDANVDVCGSILTDSSCSCSECSFCIKSVGTYKGAKRAIMVKI